MINKKENISLEEKVGQWEFDSNWSYVRLVKWSKKDKNGSVKRYTLTGKITPDKSLPMFTANILSDDKDYTHVIMHEDFDNLASFLVFVKKHMKDFPGLTDELLDTFIKYRREQSRMDESIDLNKKYGDSETLENGWTLSYDGYQAKLERADRLDNGLVKRYEIVINTHPIRLATWMANYFTNIWDESSSMNNQEYGYRSNNLFDLIREVDKTMDKFPGLTKEMFNKLVKFSEEAKKHSKEKFSQEEKESIEARNNKWFLNDNEKNHIFLAKDINAYEGNKHIVLRIVLEAFPSDKKDINDQYKLKIYKINYADGTNEIVTSKEFTDLLDFTAFMYRNLSAYNVEKEDIDLLISKCKENSVNKKEDIMTEESGFSDGWKLKKKFGDNYENRYPQLHLEYDDVKDPDNRLYYRLQINIDYFDDKGQDPFIVSRTKANDLTIQTYDYEHFDNPINFMNYMKNHLEEYPNLTMEDVNKLVKMSYDYLKDYRKDDSEGKKSFNNIFLFKDSIESKTFIKYYLNRNIEKINNSIFESLDNQLNDYSKEFNIILDNDWKLNYNLNSISLLKELNAGKNKKLYYEIKVNVNPKRIKNWKNNYFLSINLHNPLDEIIPYDSFSTEDFIKFYRYITENLKIFPGLTENILKTLFDLSSEIRKYWSKNENK